MCMAIKNNNSNLFIAAFDNLFSTSDIAAKYKAF